MGRQGGVETGRPRGRLAGRYNVIVVAFRLSRSLAAAPRRAGRGQVDWPVSRGQPGSAVKSGASRPAPTMTAATCQTDRRRRTPSGIVVRHLPLYLSDI